MHFAVRGGLPAVPAAARSRRRFLAGCLTALGGSQLGWQAASASTDEADTSDAARNDALRRLPIRQVTAEARRKILSVVESPSIYRRLPQKSVDCDPALYVFLVRNPEVVVSIWHLMGVSQMTAERVAPYVWKGNDGAGTTCDVELLYGTDDLHVMYSDGFYEGALLRRKITGRCVLLLQTGYSQSDDRRWYVGNQLDVFLQIDNTGADVIARTLSPWVGKVADANFVESCKFAQRLSATAEQNGAGVQRLADKLTNVEQDVRTEFTRVATAVQQRAAQRDVGSQIGQR